MSLVIETDGGTERSFLIDTSTTQPAGGITSGTRVAVQYQPLDADRAQALNIGLLEPTAEAGTAAASGASTPSAASTEPLDAQSRGPVDMSGPVPLLGVASLALVVGVLFVPLPYRARGWRNASGTPRRDSNSWYPGSGEKALYWESVSRARQNRRLAVLAAVLYVAVLCVSPIFHHDFDCHAKSPAHCPACLANPAAVDAEHKAPLAVPQLLEAEDLPSSQIAAAAPLLVGSLKGRSPPA